MVPPSRIAPVAEIPASPVVVSVPAKPPTSLKVPEPKPPAAESNLRSVGLRSSTILCSESPAMSDVNWKLQVPLSPPRNDALPVIVPAIASDAQTQNSPAKRRLADLFMNLPH